MSSCMPDPDIWEQIFTQQEWGKYPAEPLIRFIAKNFYAKDRSSIRILEIGCGPGANLWYLAREGFCFTGVEYSFTALQQASERLTSEIPNWKSIGELIQADITSYEFNDQEFDAIIDNECLYTIPFIEACSIYARARASLKPGGKLFVRTFTQETWGFNTGTKLEKSSFECDEGPLAGKGFSRFTSKEDIPILLDGYQDISIEKHSYTMMGDKKLISEWIVEAVKLH